MTYTKQKLASGVPALPFLCDASGLEHGGWPDATRLQVPTAEMAETPPSIRKSARTTYAESSDAR